MSAAEAPEPEVLGVFLEIPVLRAADRLATAAHSQRRTFPYRACEGEWDPA